MISIIVCSVSPDKLEAFKKNIALTIGSDYELIAFDNREKNYGITKVYNLCAAKAKFDYLCFIHEDIAFYTQNWGNIIIDKLKETNCGIIGFAGSIIKSSKESGWAQYPNYNKTNYIEWRKGKRNRIKKIFFNNIDYSIDFEEVITLDGLCLFTKKYLWEEYKFDEEVLTGFHGYDLDITLRVSSKYRNYVCNRIIIEHFSSGNYNREWVEAIIKLHEQKWYKEFPTFIGTLSKAEIKENEEFLYFLFMKYAIKSNYPFGKTLNLLYHYIKDHRGGVHTPALIGKLFTKRIFRLKF